MWGIGTTFRSAYSASKHFLNALTANMRAEVQETHPDIQFSLVSKVTAIEPAAANYDAAGGSGSSAVTLNGAGCAWTATTTDPWISITSGSGFGSGTVQYSVAANSGVSSSTRSTRLSASTPSAASALPVRSWRSASSA